MTLSTIPGAYEIRDGLPRANWSVIHEWIADQIADSDCDEVWGDLIQDWLARLVDAMGDGYQIASSANFLLLTNADHEHADRMLQRCESALRVILETLPGVASDEGHGSHVVLAFDDMERYYDYIADYYPDEGEFGLSAGIFLDDYFAHFAICLAYGNEYERTIAHELNHSLLQHLPLPLWLNEGITQIMEDTVVGSSYFGVDHELAERHRQHWNRETIDQFWIGDSFRAPDESQELSYHLAHVLVRNLMADHPKAIFDFLRQADYQDAGESALAATCNVSMQQRVAQFLGDGPWSPRLEVLQAAWRKSMTQKHDAKVTFSAAL